ncbi:MAG: UDP-N-acetylmuramoyl-L-alanine--D-glutamate ligase [Chthonomonadales bacterium]|nr:UDP-N-acetylmuramoyl-L-alanine--D-glutamate ligase [Chthonomonadales bacterium]
MVATLETSEFAGRDIAVVGLARTGVAAAVRLAGLGARVVASDVARGPQLAEHAAAAERAGAAVRLGACPEEALEGAEIVVTSPGVARDSSVLRLARDRGLSILSEIEVAYRIARAPVLAVTGTNGKTTTAMLLGHLLRAAGERTWVAGNIAADDVKQTLIAAAADAGAEDVIVAEVSSFQLEWVERFRPEIGILTNITPDHLNRHGSFEAYAACKERLFAAQRPGDVAVLNAVNAPARRIGERVPSRVMWFDRGHSGARDRAHVRDGALCVRWAGEEVDLCRAADLKVPGTHNVENALAAAAAAIAFGADPGMVAAALVTFAGVPHRMEPVVERCGVLYVNNSMCTNTDAAVRSLAAMDRPTVVIAGGLDKGADFAPFGAAIARHARHLVVIGQAAEAISSAARASGFDRVSRAASMEEAVQEAARIAVTGDAVMLTPACASQDMFADFEERGRAFREAAHRLPSPGGAP